MMAIVCGGRDYANADRVREVLDAAVVRLGLDTVIEGEAAGADALALEWAIQRPDISLIGVPADWDAGKSAGPARNRLMLKILLGHDGDKAVIAFPTPGAENRGTEGMIRMAEEHKNVRVIRVD